MTTFFCLQYLKGQNKQYLLTVGLDDYKLYHSQTSSVCVSEDVRSPIKVDCETLHWLDSGTKHYL